RIRIAYVLAALGAVAVALALIATLGGGGGGSGGSPGTEPRQVEIGGGKGPRSCVVRAAPVSETRTLTATETATASAPLRVTATGRPGRLGVSRATVATVVKQSATVTGRSGFTVKVTGRASVCARAASPEEAQRRADAAAKARARRQ